MLNHIPLPWRSKVFDESQIVILGPGSKPKLVVVCASDTKEDDVAFILKACNSYYRMRDVLKSLHISLRHGNGSAAWDDLKNRAEDVLFETEDPLDYYTYKDSQGVEREGEYLGSIGTGSDCVFIFHRDDGATDILTEYGFKEAKKKEQP